MVVFWIEDNLGKAPLQSCDFPILPAKGRLWFLLIALAAFASDYIFPGEKSARALCHASLCPHRACHRAGDLHKQERN
jgi:hypothetical protein